jgi:hypothetical protein
MGLFSNSKYQGLLTPQQQQNAGFDAIGDAGFAMLANSGWKTMPTSLGENIGKAGQAFSQSFDRSAQQTIQAQDILAQRAAAQTAAQQAQQKHAAWVAEQQRNKNELAGIMAWGAKNGMQGQPPSMIKAELEHRRAIDLEKAKANLKDNRTTIEKNLIARGLVPGTPEFSQAVAAAMAKPGTNISIGGGGPSILDDVARDEFKNANEQAAIAGAKLRTLREATTLLSTGVPTGTIQNAALPVRKMLSEFGVENPNIPIQEALNSVGDQMALDQHGPGMGPLTEADFIIYQGIVPGLKNTPAGNALIAHRMEREYLGRQIYQEELKKQLSQPGGSKNYDTAAAWRETAKRLDNTIGPLVPKYENAEAALADKSVVGRVVMVGGKPFYLKP